MSVSRQRNYQKRMREEGKCITCGRPAEPSMRRGRHQRSPFCLKHLVKNREVKHTGRVRRNTESASYKREKEETKQVVEPEFFYVGHIG